MLKSTWNQFLEKRNLTLLFYTRSIRALCLQLFSDRFNLRDYSIDDIYSLLVVLYPVDRRFRKTNKDYWLGEEMSFDGAFIKDYDIICAHYS